MRRKASETGENGITEFLLDQRPSTWYPSDNTISNQRSYTKAQRRPLAFRQSRVYKSANQMSRADKVKRSKLCTAARALPDTFASYMMHRLLVWYLRISDSCCR